MCIHEEEEQQQQQEEEELDTHTYSFMYTIRYDPSIHNRWSDGELYEAICQLAPVLQL